MAELHACVLQASATIYHPSGCRCFPPLYLMLSVAIHEHDSHVHLRDSTVGGKKDAIILVAVDSRGCALLLLLLLL